MSVSITHLGGLGEFGKNCLLVAADGGAIIVDAGISFGDETLPGIGVDRVAPDFSALAGERIAAIFLTHGHEDHIGALAMLLDVVDAPVFATPFTAALADRRLADEGRDADLRAVAFRTPIDAGPFRVELFPVSHSVPQSAALAIEAEGRRLFHTGDFKFDDDAPPGERTDLDAIAAWAGGCDLLMIDSTNADKAGFCASEAEARSRLRGLVADGGGGRIVLTTFSSHVVRVGAAAEAARAAGRKVALFGRSMSEIADLAERHGYLTFPAGSTEARDSIGELAPHRAFLLCAGSQGEPGSALARLAAGSHPDVRVSPGDRVLFSARTIPGRESAVARVVDDFLRAGATVVRDAAHVSGHAYRGDLERLVAAIGPGAVLPVHGRRESLEHAAAAARAAGVAAGRVFVAENGDSLRIGDTLRLERGAWAAGAVALDAAGSVAIGEAALRERRQMAAAGVVVVTIDLAARAVAGVAMRGVAVSDGASAGVVREIEAAFARASRAEAVDREWLLREAGLGAKRYFRREHAVAPLVVPIPTRGS